MSESRQPGRMSVGSFRSQLAWLLVLLIAAGGVVLALLGLGMWLIFASGALATFAVVGLARPREAAGTGAFVRHAESGWAYLRTEMARSRRHDRRFALVGVPADVFASEAASGDGIDFGLTVAASIQGLLRRPDRAWFDGSRLYVLLTECDRQRGLAFLARARATAPRLFADERLRLVVFPDDGITSGALLSALDGQPAVEPVPQEAAPR